MNSRLSRRKCQLQTPLALSSIEERLNADLKKEMGKRVPVRTKAKLRNPTSAHLLMLEQNAERVMSYLQDRRVKYAAYDFIGSEQ